MTDETSAALLAAARPASGVESMNDPEFARECFRNPQLYRDQILRHVRVEPREQFDGKSVFYMWMDKACPVGCDFCFFQSPALTEKTPQTAITPDGIERQIEFLNDANIDQLFISGGGEPMLKKAQVNRLIQGASVREVVIITSSHWSQTPEGTEKTLADLLRSAEENPRGPSVVVRLSLDRFHLEKLCKGRGFQYVKNLINEFERKYIGNPRLTLKIHTMDGDETVDNLLRELEVKNREDSGGYLKRKSRITLASGLEFPIEFSQEFQTDSQIDMNANASSVDHNVHSFQEFIDVRRNGNMSLSFNPDGPKGVYWLMLYDGTMLVWGATSPDAETSLYKHDYSTTMERNRSDVLTLSTLENGTFYRESLVSEVDPMAVRRARGMGLRDFHARASLERPNTRLYASLRAMQDYRAAGRISDDDMETWPNELHRLMAMSPADLAEAYRDTDRTIVGDMLAIPGVRAQDLVALSKRVALGHYHPLTVETMIERVSASDLPESTKGEFFQLLLFSGVHAASLGGATRIADVTRAPHSLHEAQPDPTDLPIIELKTTS
jgi:uncharacterized Fe-S cluster-containing radical SAM superfamily protein